MNTKHLNEFKYFQFSQGTTASPSFATAGSQEAMKTHKIKESRSTVGKMNFREEFSR